MSEHMNESARARDEHASLGSLSRLAIYRKVLLTICLEKTLSLASRWYCWVFRNAFGYVSQPWSRSGHVGATTTSCKRPLWAAERGVERRQAVSCLCGAFKQPAPASAIPSPLAGVGRYRTGRAWPHPPAWGWGRGVPPSDPLKQRDVQRKIFQVIMAEFWDFSVLRYGFGLASEDRGYGC